MSRHPQYYPLPPNNSQCITQSLCNPNSMVSSGVTSIPNYLHSANNLANCEETQELGSNYTSGSQLSGAKVLDLLQEAFGACLGCGLFDRLEEGFGVSCALQDLLEVHLEC
jgi:hypothetical protein